MRTTKLVVLGALAVAAGCGGDDSNNSIDAPPGTPDSPPGTPDAPPNAPDAPPSVFDASGTVVGPAAAAGPVVGIWPVDGMGNDYAYKFGDGTSANGTTFTLGLPSDPPAMARTMGPGVDIGVGIAVLLTPGASVPEGVLTSDPPVVGITTRHAIIYRGASDTGAIVPWTTAFPVGLSCGVCVDEPSGFDSWAPTDCTTMVIDTDQTAPVCNWM